MNDGKQNFLLCAFSIAAYLAGAFCYPAHDAIFFIVFGLIIQTVELVTRFI